MSIGIFVRSPEPFHLPGIKPAQVFERAQKLVRTLGDVPGPVEAHFEDHRNRALRNSKDEQVEATTDEEREFLGLLAPAKLFRTYQGHTYVRRDDATAPLPDEAALAERVMRTKTLTLVYLFAQATNGEPLPHQEDATWSRLPDPMRGRASSRLQLMPHLKQETILDFVFPFPSFEDPAFLERYEAMQEILGAWPPSVVKFAMVPEWNDVKPPKGFGKKK